MTKVEMASYAASLITIVQHAEDFGTDPSRSVRAELSRVLEELRKDIKGEKK